jgi:hypothetical protein
MISGIWQLTCLPFKFLFASTADGFLLLKDIFTATFWHQPVGKCFADNGKNPLEY